MAALSNPAGHAASAAAPPSGTGGTGVTGAAEVTSATMPAAPPLPAIPPSAASAAAQTTHPAVPATAESAANAPIPGQDALFSWGGYFEALAWLCFLLALLWLALWLIKKRGLPGLPGASTHMRIESRLALGPKKWIIVTRYRDTRLVLGVTDHQITLLTEMPLDDDDYAEGSGQSGGERDASGGTEAGGLPKFLQGTSRRGRGQGAVSSGDGATGAAAHAPNTFSASGTPESSTAVTFAALMKKETGDG